MAFLTMFVAFYLALVAYRATEMGYKAVMRRKAKMTPTPLALGVPDQQMALYDASEPSLDGVTSDSPVEGDKEDKAQKQEQRPYGTFVW